MRDVFVQLYAAKSFLRRHLSLIYSRISEHFMEPDGSLLCSQEPSNGPYTEPDQPSPYHPILSKTHLYIILPSTSMSS
jgi:hypothetical protein